MRGMVWIRIDTFIRFIVYSALSERNFRVTNQEEK